MKVISSINLNKKKIVFENFSGNGYGDNLKYICEEIISRKLDYDLVWIVDKDSQYSFPKEIRVVKKNTLKEINELATAKIWVDNNRKATHIYKNKKKQFYIQTWHAFYWLKRIEADAESSLSPMYVKMAKRDSKMIDVFISGSAFATKQYRDYFWYSGEVLEIGTPRNDVFFHNFNYKEKICKHFGIDIDTKLLLYAPTFRDNHSIEAYNIDFYNVKNELEKRKRSEWKILVRFHPALRKVNVLDGFDDSIIDASGYDDMQELLAGVDLLITDYSSCMFEFALSQKPVIIYASDIDEFNNGRGLIRSIRGLPFPIAENNIQLKTIIANYDVEVEKKRVESFMSEIGSFEGGNASSEIVDYIVNKLEEK